jgi:hypothetical protein
VMTAAGQTHRQVRERDHIVFLVPAILSR